MGEDWKTITYITMYWGRVKVNPAKIPLYLPYKKKKSAFRSGRKGDVFIATVCEVEAWQIGHNTQTLLHVWLLSTGENTRWRALFSMHISTEKRTNKQTNWKQMRSSHSIIDMIEKRWALDSKWPRSQSWLQKALIPISKQGTETLLALVLSSVKWETLLSGTGNHIKNDSFLPMINN